MTTTDDTSTNPLAGLTVDQILEELSRRREEHRSKQPKNHYGEYRHRPVREMDEYELADELRARMTMPINDLCSIPMGLSPREEQLWCQGLLAGVRRRRVLEQRESWRRRALMRIGVEIFEQLSSSRRLRDVVTDLRCTVEGWFRSDQYWEEYEARLRDDQSA